VRGGLGLEGPGAPGTKVPVNFQASLRDGEAGAKAPADSQPSLRDARKEKEEALYPALKQQAILRGARLKHRATFSGPYGTQKRQSTLLGTGREADAPPLRGV